MFKNLIMYEVGENFGFSFAALEAAAEKAPFVECGATQEISTGWIPPRGEEHGALVENVGGQWIMRLMVERRTLSAATIRKHLAKKLEAWEDEYGYAPGRKMKRELLDEVKLDLLPTAQIQQSSTFVWIDKAAKRIYIDTASQGRADIIVTLLVESVKGLGVALVDTKTSPQAAMAHWLLTSESPGMFSIDRECELKAADESKAVVRYKNHPLDTDEVKEHVRQGKFPVSLAMTFDDRVSFVLTDAGRLKSIRLLDGVLDNAGDDAGFDTDVAIATGELSKMIPRLLKALGGTADRRIGGSDDVDDDDDPAAGL